jgi:AcrR family transcriptional regulator
MAGLRSNQQSRTEATRGKLLAAAARVFARDGFEAARIEEIAARAGYTRGAFYANFESKEDLFLSLLEQWIGERIDEVKAIFSRHHKAAERRSALREYYAGRASNRNLALLSMEFRLFALRHPGAHARFRVRLLRLRVSGGRLLGALLKARGRSFPLSGRAGAAGLAALSNALVIEQLIAPRALSAEHVRRMLRLFFDALTEGRPRK